MISQEPHWLSNQHESVTISTNLNYGRIANNREVNIKRIVKVNIHVCVKLQHQGAIVYAAMPSVKVYRPLL